MAGPSKEPEPPPSGKKPSPDLVLGHPLPTGEETILARTGAAEDPPFPSPRGEGGLRRTLSPVGADG